MLLDPWFTVADSIITDAFSFSQNFKRFPDYEEFVVQSIIFDFCFFEIYVDILITIKI